MDLPQRTNNLRNRTRVVYPLGPLVTREGQSQRAGSKADVMTLRRILPGGDTGERLRESGLPAYQGGGVHGGADMKRRRRRTHRRRLGR